MKKILLSLVVTIALFNVNAQNSYTLIGTDHYFDPDTLYVAPGDTVHFTSIGYHSATEIDSVDWANNIDNPNGGFDVGFGAPTSDMWFVINNVGKYYYICEPHASMGMKGVIYVQQGVSISEANRSDNFEVFQSADNTIQLEYLNSNQIEVYDIGGKLLLSEKMDSSANRKELNLDLSPGVYIFRFSLDGNPQVSMKKFIE